MEWKLQENILYSEEHDYSDVVRLFDHIDDLELVRAIIYVLFDPVTFNPLINSIEEVKDKLKAKVENIISDLPKLFNIRKWENFQKTKEELIMEINNPIIDYRNEHMMLLVRALFTNIGAIESWALSGIKYYNPYELSKFAEKFEKINNNDIESSNRIMNTLFFYEKKCIDILFSEINISNAKMFYTIKEDFIQKEKDYSIKNNNIFHKNQVNPHNVHLEKLSMIGRSTIWPAQNGLYYCKDLKSAILCYADEISQNVNGEMLHQYLIDPTTNEKFVLKTIKNIISENIGKVLD